MEDSGFIKYDTVKEILEDASFFGFTASREDGGRRITYHFKSVKWYRTNISVTVLKLEPGKPLSEKIVIGIKFNGEDVEGIGDFRKRVEELGKSHEAAKKQKGKQR